MHPPGCFPHSIALTLPFGGAVLTANNDALHLTAMILGESSNLKLYRSFSIRPSFFLSVLFSGISIGKFP